MINKVTLVGSAITNSIIELLTIIIISLTAISLRYAENPILVKSTTSVKISDAMSYGVTCPTIVVAIEPSSHHNYFMKFEHNPTEYLERYSDFIAKTTEGLQWLSLPYYWPENGNQIKTPDKLLSSNSYELRDFEYEDISRSVKTCINTESNKCLQNINSGLKLYFNDEGLALSLDAEGAGMFFNSTNFKSIVLIQKPFNSTIDLLELFVQRSQTILTETYFCTENVVANAEYIYSDQHKVDSFTVGLSYCFIGVYVISIGFKIVAVLSKSKRVVVSGIMPDNNIHKATDIV